MMLNRVAIAALLLLAPSARAGLPGTYRIALIQVEYPGAPAAYTRAQLVQAAAEMSAFYSDASYRNLKVEFQVSTFGSFGSPPGAFFTFDKNNVASADPSDAAVAGAMAGAASVIDHIDLSRIDGVAVVNSFCAGSQYTVAGPVTVKSPAAAAGTYEVAWLFECPFDTRLANPGPSGVFWGPWAHEIGHMLEIKSGTALGGNWNGHPGAYSSGYALMDSAYPSSPSAYSVVGTSFMAGEKRVFNGWLPDSKVITIPAPASSFSSTDVALRALSETPYVTFNNQVIKIPISGGVYYLVEARTRTGVDALPTTLSKTGVWDEGVRITRVDESADPPAVPINTCETLVAGGCDTGNGDLSTGRLADPRHVNCYGPQGASVDSYPAYCWPFPLFHVGDAFTGEGQIRIAVKARTSDGYLVNVVRGLVSATAEPGIMPRPVFDAPPGFGVSGATRHQIWVDSSCNGYAAEVGPSGLRFGDPAIATTFAVGDDLCLGHENRIYARIENRGGAPAQALRVHFELGQPAAPQGCVPRPDGMQCPPRFFEVGVADGQSFPELAMLAPGASATVFVPFTPPRQLEGARFFTPALRVWMEPAQGQLAEGELLAESSLARVQAIAGSNGNVVLSGPAFSFFNQGSDDLTSFLAVSTTLPRGVTVSTGAAPAHFTLAAYDKFTAPLSFQIDSRAARGAGRFAANVQLSAFIPQQNPWLADDHGDVRVIAAQTVGLDLVEASKLSLAVTADRRQASRLHVRARLNPARPHALVTLEYTGLDGKAASKLVRFEGELEGEQQAILDAAPGTAVSAVWAGDLTHAPATAGPVLPR